jgi:hypothetical protein
VLEKLRNLNIERMIDLDEAVALFAFGNMVLTSYKDQTLEPPAWLTDNLSVLGKDIKERRRDNLEAALKEALAKKSALRTAEEKRADLDGEIERLQKALA